MAKRIARIHEVIAAKPKKPTEWCQVKAKARAERYRRNRTDRIKAARIKWRYGLAPAEHARLLQEQGGACAICGLVGALVIDHCHNSEVVRGLLCNNCNVALAHIKESPQNAEALLRYINERCAPCRVL